MESLNIPHHLRDELCRLLPSSDPEQQFIILSIGSGDTKQCLDAMVIRSVLDVRGVENYRYIGIDINRENIASLVKAYKKDKPFAFLALDATKLSPEQLGFKPNSVDLIILRHPEFCMFLNFGESTRNPDLSVKDLAKLFTSLPCDLADKQQKAFIIAPTAADIKYYKRTTDKRQFVSSTSAAGVYRTILETTIPQFIKPMGYMFVSCYRKKELAAVMHHSQAYSQEDYQTGENHEHTWRRRSDFSEQLEQMYVDGHYAAIPVDEEKLQRMFTKSTSKQDVKNACDCGLFRRGYDLVLSCIRPKQATQTEKPKII